MIIEYDDSRKHKIMFGLLSILNPLPKRLKLRKDGGYLQDWFGRRRSERVTRAELARRKLDKEETRQCFKITSRGSVDMRGSTG